MLIFVKSDFLVPYTSTANILTTALTYNSHRIPLNEPMHYQTKCISCDNKCYIYRITHTDVVPANTSCIQSLLLSATKRYFIYIPTAYRYGFLIR